MVAGFDADWSWRLLIDTSYLWSFSNAVCHLVGKYGIFFLIKTQLGSLSFILFMPYILFWES